MTQYEIEAGLNDQLDTAAAQLGLTAQELATRILESVLIDSEEDPEVLEGFRPDPESPKTAALKDD